jgi:hypothetical protein
VCVEGACTTVLADPTCGEDDKVLCALTGALGQEVACKLGVAAASPSAPIATAIQFTLSYDADRMAIVNFFDEVCFQGAGCFTMPMTGPGAFAMSTGHSVSVAPPSMKNWQGYPCSEASPCGNGDPCIDGVCNGKAGFGGVVIVNLSNPTKPLGEAYYSEDGSLFGDTPFLEARFQLLDQAPAGDPVALYVGDLLASDANSDSIPVTVIDGAFVTFAADSGAIDPEID